MKHTYHIHGMTCNGCRNHVEKALSEVDDVIRVNVNLETEEAAIEMKGFLPIEKFQEALKKERGRYTIHKPGEQLPLPKKKDKSSRNKVKGTFYCPMHCEGDKTYDTSGDCPVCGMDLVESITSLKIIQHNGPAQCTRKLLKLNRDPVPFVGWI